MQSKSFVGTALVEIQGVHALDFVRREREYAEYQVPGYADQIILRDYRSSSLSIIDDINLNGRTETFADEFSTPAFVKTSDLDSPTLSIELHNTADRDPRTRLWIAVGIAEVPNYDYIHKRITPYDDSFVLLALYSRALQPQIFSSSCLSEVI